MTTTQRAKRHFLNTASILLGAFFLCTTASCKEKPATADWQNNTGEQSPQQTQDTPDQNPEKKPATPPETTPTQKEPKTTPEKTGKPIRFLAYNLKNYLTMPRYSNNQRTNSPKPEDEIEALVKIIHQSRPDIIGICEIGTPADLAEFQKRLKQAGTDLPHSHQLLEYDPVRTLALLSRYPIIATAKPAKDDYQVGNTPFKISRGILDATVQLPDKKVRLLGVHFKSKRPVREADQELMRRAESSLLRKHVDEILNSQPDSHLLVYGDFNDTFRTPTLRTSMGRLNSKTGLIVLRPQDSRGEVWTHHWRREDIYSRIDFVMVSKSLDPLIDKKNMLILDDPGWEKASDHRGILVPIR